MTGAPAPGADTEPIDLSGAVLQVGVVPLGARLAMLRAPDRDGAVDDVVVGLADYTTDTAYLGATVGRYANRLAGGSFVLDGRRYTVPCNEGGANEGGANEPGANEPGVALHGGPDAFDRQVFRADPVVDAPDGSRSVTLRRTSPAGENGFPGTLDVVVTYTVRGAELTIELTATTDAATVVNLTNHAYWNLAGGGSVEDHVVTIRAAHYLPVDPHLIPTGELAQVDHTPFDLRRPTRLGAHLRDGHPQLRRARGYDHTFVLDHAVGEPRAAAHVEDPLSGRTLTVLTDQPGVQFYSGNMLDGTLVRRDGTTVRQGDAFCLEPQHFPNAPNEPAFPSTVLWPDDVYRNRMTMILGVQEVR